MRHILNSKLQILIQAGDDKAISSYSASYRAGAALLFFDMDIAGSKGDRRALHASCPTLHGTKWTATKWIHNHPQGEVRNGVPSLLTTSSNERCLS